MAGMNMGGYAAPATTTTAPPRFPSYTCPMHPGVVSASRPMSLLRHGVVASLISNGARMSTRRFSIGTSRPFVLVLGLSDNPTSALPVLQTSVQENFHARFATDCGIRSHAIVVVS